MRSPLHELRHIRHSRQRVLDNALIFVRHLRKMRLAAQLLDVITIGLRRRHPPSRSMRLLQKSRLRQIRHHIPDRRRTQPLPRSPRKRPRPHRLPAGNERLNNRRQDFPFPTARWHWWHKLSIQQKLKSHFVSAIDDHNNSHHRYDYDSVARAPPPAFNLEKTHLKQTSKVWQKRTSFPPHTSSTQTPP